MKTVSEKVPFFAGDRLTLDIPFCLCYTISGTII